MLGNRAREWQFDGLVGPTHNYAGLSFGNVASEKHAGAVSNPQAAALQGIEKMRFVAGLGVPQSFIPPQKRPKITELQRLGFGAGNSAEAIALTLDNAYKQAPHLLAAVFSSSFMWAANAATVSPSADTKDGRLHLTPANLTSHFHRAIESEGTTRTLKTIFHNESLFAIHNPLNPSVRFADEGAANHMRVCASHGEPGVELFVYGVADGLINKPKIFPARQHQEAGKAIGRLHGLDASRFLMAQQHPDAIDQGVFHHDVIAMNTTRLMIAHEHAIVHKEKIIDELKRSLDGNFHYVEIPQEELSVAEAVKSYLFNSQLLELPDGKFVLLAPIESKESNNTHMTIRRLVEGNGIISNVHYLDVRESMRNGGGPACLRLRVVMTEKEAASIHSGAILNEDKANILTGWVERHYRDRLELADLRDPNFVRELDEAYDALENLIGMPGLYSNLP